MELTPAQRRIRDFYFKEALAAPRTASHVHRAGLVSGQSLFSMSDLRRHLNDPLLDLNHLNLFKSGAPVDLSSARLYKVVQRRRIEFVDHRALDQHLQQGAACVLEGVDILEPAINALAAALDRAHATTFCNATVFFSQHGHEAYRGHVDTDDVLVIHLAGEKRWRLYRPQGPRRVRLSDLSDAEMGPLETEIVLRPGDVLYLRSFTPHKVETLSAHSLHLSFDLCDRQPSVEVALQLLLQHYDKNAAAPLTSTSEVLDKLLELSRSARYGAALDGVLANDKAGHAEFRRLLAGNRIKHLDRFIEDTRSAVRSRSESGPAIGDSVDCAGVIVRDEQRTVAIHQHVRRPAPRLFPLQPARREGLVGHRAAAFEPHQRDPIADLARAVPGAVLGDEDLIAVSGRKLPAGVEAHAQRRHVRAEILCGLGEFGAGALLAVFRIRNRSGVTIGKTRS